MTDNNHLSNDTLRRLKQQLLDRVEQIDDPALLSRCIAIIDMSHEMDEVEKQDALSAQAEQSDAEAAEKAAQAAQKRRRTILRVCAAFALIAVIAAAGFSVMYLIRSGRQRTQQQVTVAKEYETIEVNGCSFNMVKVKGGTFVMGATVEQDDEGDNDELPLQTVTLDDYMIGETEVTQGLWYAVMGERPISPDGDDHPMKEVSHDECLVFIRKLNELTGRHFSLPTEAQWEFAARGGNESKHYKYAGSNDIDEVAWYSANCWDLGKESPEFGNHPVATKKPNELGLYDMSGNVWEWCHESYISYDGQPKHNPGLHEDAQGSYRCNRGGSWDYIATSARVSNRRNRTRDFRNFNLGLRLAE